MMSKQQKNFKTLTITAIIIVLAAGVLFLNRGHHKAGNEDTQTQEPISVQVVTAANQPIPEEVWATGTVAPIAQAQLAPRIMSTVSAVYVREGDHVRAGQVLARLEAKDLAAQVASARAAVDSARSMRDKAGTGIELQVAQTRANIANAESALEVAKQQLALVSEGPRRQEKAQAQLAVVQAEAQFKNAQTELARMKRLYDQGVIPKQRLDGVQTQFDVAQAQLGILKEQASISEEGSRMQDIQSAKERVKQAEEALRLAKAAAVQNKMAKRDAQAAVSAVAQARAGENSAKVMLGYATIVSPISGVVSARYVDPGDTASPGAPILVVEDDSVYRLEASVADKDVNSVRQGMTVGLEMGADKQMGYGKVAIVVPAGDPSTRKFTVKVNVPKDMNAKSGDFGRVAFPVGYSRGILVPPSALHDQGGIINVFVVGANNRTDLRIVRVGRTTSNGVEIITGLKDGDRVVVKSNVPLTDDAPVKIEGS